MVSRRYAAGARGARGLLFTVLGELVLPRDAPAWSSALIDVVGRLNVEEKAARQALARMAADGWLRGERVGRRTRWHLTSKAEQLLVQGTQRIYEFAGPRQGWDGRWLVLVAQVPEEGRASRHRLRTRLLWAGLGSPAPGVWLGTDVARFDEVTGVLGEVGILHAAQVFVAEHRAGLEPSRLVAQTWDVAAIDAEYRRFLAEWGGQATGVPLARLVALVHAWRRFPLIDPGLPVELLPPGWRAADAVALFRRQHARWAAAAGHEWEQLNSP